MGGVVDHIEALTITELRKKTRAWARKRREGGSVVHHGWQRDQVEKTKRGYRIRVHAYTK